MRSHFYLVLIYFLALILVAGNASGETLPSPYMNMPIPEVGVTPGPAWASAINQSLYILDQHNHTPGYGQQIPPAGININTALTFQDNLATYLMGIQFQVQTSALSAVTYPATTYVSGADLYYNDTNGNQVQITAFGAVNATSSGISNGTASASFSGPSGSQTLIVNGDTSKPGNIEVGSVLIGNNTVGSNFAKLSAPTALALSYTLTLPTGNPASTSFVTIDTSGNIVASYPVAAVALPGTLSVASTTTLSGTLALETYGAFSVGTGLFTSQDLIISNSSTTGGISFSVNGIKLGGISHGGVLHVPAGSSGTGPGFFKYASSTNSIGLYNAAETHESPIVVSGAPATNGLLILRGYYFSVSSGGCGTITSGEGVSCSRNSLGTFTLTFSTAFQDTPSCNFTSLTNGGGYPIVANFISLSSSAVAFQEVNAITQLFVDNPFTFICIGQRNSSD